jgi:hypothetical protein
MRWLGTLILVALGVALVGALQWTAAGAPGLPAALPAFAQPALPLAAFLIFGVYLVSVFGGVPGPGRAALAALAALLVAGVPFVYALGLAATLHLPAGGGAVGTWLAGPYARAGAALWLPVAVVSAFRRPARRRFAPPPPVAAPEPQPAPAEMGPAVAVGAAEGEQAPPA